MRKMIVALSTALAMLTVGSAAALASGRGVPGATPACGTQCFDLSSLVLGRAEIQNAYIAGDTGVGGRVGQAVDLNRASNSHPNQDFTDAFVGTLRNFCGGVIPARSYVCITYPRSFPVFESDWSPYGNESGLCVGIKLPGYRGERITLRRCGVSAATLWVGDRRNATVVAGHVYLPWVNAADTAFSHPLVLTVDTGSRHPGNLLKVERLNFLTGRVVRDSQEFTLTFGAAS
jgi:hypothetical protein